jgi:hypothetical protein
MDALHMPAQNSALTMAITLHQKMRYPGVQTSGKTTHNQEIRVD